MAHRLLFPLLVVAVLALVVFGPERLPEMGRSLGKGLNQLKRMASDVKSEFDLSLEDEKAAAPTRDAAPAQSDEIPPTVEAVEAAAADPASASPAQAARV